MPTLQLRRVEAKRLASQSLVADKRAKACLGLRQPKVGCLAKNLPTDAQRFTVQIHHFCARGFPVQPPGRVCESEE